MTEQANTTTGAEPVESGAQTPAVAGAAEETQKQPSFDELLKNREYQAEFDRRVSKAIDTAKGGWNANFEEVLKNKLAEAEKLAKMNAEEKAAFERKRQEEDYQKRIAAVTKRELAAEAREQLARDGVPQELAEVLNYTDAESCKASMEAIKTAFFAATEKAVNEKLKGSTPKAGADKPDLAAMSDEDYYNFISKKQE